MRITLEPWERSQDEIHSENKRDSEITKVDLTQEGREFIDQFERDLHQAGYPNCRIVSTTGVPNNCPADNSNPNVAKNSAVAVDLVSVSNTQIIFEGDVDGDGLGDTVRCRLVDSAGNYPPAGTCPCTIQRTHGNDDHHFNQGKALGCFFARFCGEIQPIAARISLHRFTGRHRARIIGGGGLERGQSTGVQHGYTGLS